MSYPPTTECAQGRRRRRTTTKTTTTRGAVAATMALTRFGSLRVQTTAATAEKFVCLTYLYSLNGIRGKLSGKKPVDVEEEEEHLFPEIKSAAASTTARLYTPSDNHQHGLWGTCSCFCCCSPSDRAGKRMLCDPGAAAAPACTQRRLR